MRPLVLLISLFCTLSCTGKGEGPSPGSAEPGRAEPGTPTRSDAQAAAAAAAPSSTPPRAKKQPEVLRDLVREANRAELDAGGLFIDVGSLDMHKYSRGGWMSGWGRNALDDDATVAVIEDRAAWLDVELSRPAREIVIRARGRGKLGVALGKGRAKRVSVSAEYGVHRVALAKALPPGRHRIKLVGRKTAVDWVWLSDELGAEPPSWQRTSLGEGTTASLLAPTPRSYRFHLIPDPGAELRFWSRGDQKAEIRVWTQRDGGEAKELLTLRPGSAWREVSVPLPGPGGTPLRLVLESREGAVEWREVALVRDALPEFSPKKHPKNVIVLLIDTQRADSFSVVSSSGGIGASAYESLVKTSSTFENAYNSENWTKPSIASIDTGLYPTSHLARWRKDRCSADLVFLSEHLQDQGFATGALVSNLSAGPKFGFDQGWDVFEKTDNAQHAFGRALHWLDNRDESKRFFLYVQTIDPHVPFSVPQGSAEALYGGTYRGKLGSSFEQSEEDALNAGKMKLNKNDERWLRALYDAEVLYHDKHLGGFLAGLRERGILEDTAFVILNDHGEEFGEHGRWGHSWTMGDALFRSPLLMHFPDFFPVRTVPEVVEHIDVAPTIVDALGVSAMDSAQGKSLLPLLHGTGGRGLHSALLFGRPRFRAVRVGDFKLVLRGSSKQELFNIRTDADQTTDVLEQHPIALRLAELALGEAIANPRKSERLQDRSTAIHIRAEDIDE